jgi:hypothetical protein
MPQPLSKVNSEASIHIGNNTDNPSDNRPHLALLAMKVIGEWSILESFLRGLFVQMLGANPAPAAAMYSALSGAQAQRSVFRAVAEVALPGHELEIFEAIFSIYSTAAKERNKIVHWVWGHSPQIPDGVLLCDPDVLMDYRVKIEQYKIRILARERIQAPEFPKDQIFVYYQHDFTGASERIQRLIDLVMRFSFVVNRDHPANREGRLFAKLAQEPEIAEYVARLRQRQKSNQ